MATNPNAALNELRERLPGLPTKLMKYAAQVVWLLDPADADMALSADGLHGKRYAAGDGAKSAKVTGLSPNWPSLPETSDNIRLYVVAHGVRISGTGPVQVKIQTGQPLASHVKTAAEFFPILKAFIQKSPAQRVRRIGLVVCNAGGIDPDIATGQSFAKQLADLCAGLTGDVTARRSDVLVGPKNYPKAAIDAAVAPHANPLYTVMVDGESFSVVTAKKVSAVETKIYPRYRTYIFAPGQAPVLKPKASE